MNRPLFPACCVSPTVAWNWCGTRPNPLVIQPWETPDGGWSWTLAPAAELEPTDAPSPCPTLVTIGRHDGADVLLNLETCGVVSIAGDPAKVVDVARSITSELATSVFAESPTVLVIGELSLVGQPEHARAVEPDEAVGWLRDRSESASALLAHRRLTSLFALRARSKPLDAHEPVVVVIETAHIGAEQLAEIADMAHGDLGAVVVLVGPEPASEWRLVVEPDVTRLEPLGLQLDPVSIDEAFVSAADEFIPPADPELDESVDDAWDDDAEVDGQLVLADHLDIIHLHNRALPLDEEPTSGGEPAEDGADDWDVELKVLGQVRAIGTKEPLSPTELHLAIYLAFNRSGENADTIATMLWPNGINPRTLTNAMASLRRKLGTGADGEPLFPLGRDNQYTYSLSDRVVTDWDRFVALVDRAGRCDDEDDEADLLDQALELIDGPPFRAATGYSWAYSDGTATLICDTVRAAGMRAVSLHDPVAISHGPRVPGIVRRLCLTTSLCPMTARALPRTRRQTAEPLACVRHMQRSALPACRTLGTYPASSRSQSRQIDDPALNRVVEEALRAEGVIQRLVAPARAAAPAPPAAAQFAPAHVAFFSAPVAELLVVLPRRSDVLKDVESPVARLYR